MTIFEGLENSEIRITNFQRKLINDHRIRVQKHADFKEKLNNLKYGISRAKIMDLKIEVLNSKRYLETDVAESEGLRDLNKTLTEEKNILGILESDSFRLRNQVSELPLGTARDDLLLFLRTIEDIKQPTVKLEEINKIVAKLMQELEVIIEKEKETLESMLNLLVAIGVKRYENVTKEIEELNGKAGYFELNLRREEENIVLPLKALIDQKREVHRRIDEIKANFQSEQKLDLEKIKNDLRNLNPLQAKEYLDLLQKIINNYYTKGIDFNKIRNALNFVSRFKSFFERKRTKIEAEKLTQSAEILSKTKEMTRIDPLTGLKNRRAMEEELEIRLKQLYRNGGVLGFIMIDIDHFKSVNDTWGHPVGDIALKFVVEALKESLRTGDSAFRYGGEEIAIIITNNPSEENLLVIGNRMRERVTNKIENEKLRNNVIKQIGTRKITISLGAVCMHLDERKSYDSETIKQRIVDLKVEADKLLYVAKNNGRNQVRIARIDI